jgi:uncharacterized protein (DUF58 family)
MLSTYFFRELDRFSFMIKKRVSSIYAGERRSIRKGTGTEAVDHREYYPGDDIKRVDWKVYARTEKLYIRRFEEEKSLTTHILLDASRSMDFGEPKKFDYASMIGAGFAYLVTKENERFALSLFSDEMRHILQPNRGRRHFLNVVDFLNGVAPEGGTRMEVATRLYMRMIKTRSLVVLISDFLEPLPTLEKGIYQIARSSHDLVVIQVLAPEERDLEWTEGDTKMQDLETGEEMALYVSPRFREEYRRRLSEHLSGIEKACREVGAEFYSFTTDTPIFDAFLEIMG